MLRRIELYFKDVIRLKRRGIVASTLRGLLSFGSVGYATAVACRNWAFERGFLCRYVPPVPLVISVGNIVAGGTGKTPTTLKIVEAFYDKFAIAVLSRGYRSAAEHLATPLCLSQGNGPLFPATYCGDEPYLIANRFPKAWVVVGRDRHASANIAAKGGAELILLDDGLQHRWLARDFEVVVVDASDPLGQGHFLPRGFLRESPHALKRAHLIVLNHVRDQEHYTLSCQQLRAYTAAPFVGARLMVKDIWDAQGQSHMPIRGQKVGLFSAIGNPDHFRTTIENLGGEVVYMQSLPDHDTFSLSQIQACVQQSKANGAQLLLCTEKDWVKCPPLGVLDLPVAFVESNLHIVEGQAHWQEFIDRAGQILRQRL